MSNRNKGRIETLLLPRNPVPEFFKPIHTQLPTVA